MWHKMMSQIRRGKVSFPYLIQCEQVCTIFRCYSNSSDVLVNRSGLKTNLSLKKGTNDLTEHVKQQLKKYAPNI